MYCIYIYFEDAPRVNFGEIGKSITIEEGSQLKVNCFADGNPDPENYTWIRMSEQKRLVSTLHTLYINPVQRKDAGLVACEVTNRIGNGKTETNIIVTCRYFRHDSYIVLILNIYFIHQ